MKENYINLHNQLVKNGIEVISEESEFVHVSGHPNRDDLKDMYNWVKPKCVIPVHGEHRHMIEHINFAKEMQVPLSCTSRERRYSKIISLVISPKFTIKLLAADSILMEILALKKIHNLLKIEKI